MLNEKGPILLACNHPNSFLDGVILDTIFEQPLYSLARGDVFKNPAANKFLTRLHLLPVYRTSEGVENLSSNYETFDECLRIFRQDGIVIIFSEGRCINEWHLRPLKKGTARLTMAAWGSEIPLRVLPVGINYSSFRRFGKNLFINFGTFINSNEVDLTLPEGTRYQAFNQLLEDQLGQLVFEIDKKDKEKQRRLLQLSPSTTEWIFFFIPAMLGLLIHAPMYLPVKYLTLSWTRHNDHYDSVVTALLLFLYPAYLVALSIIAYSFTKSPLSFLIILVAPLMAWAYVRLKPQLDR
ncbi:MAG: 1-acyl-sn-glycerol-3-phosphate acyltransferase [Chitinophagaceae bacterium]|nr:1-acyl-sn-glycerol-3-phosphate acyltransferase [Chitinophagaceae bacterium]